VADEELRVGADVVVVVVVEPVPVLPVEPVVPSSEESDVVVDEELPASVVAADFDDEDVDVAEVFTALASGRSWATTTPMATVAPVAATIAPRVSVRSRDCALSLSAGVLGWADSGM
jgi:hypothetical protein